MSGTHDLRCYFARGLFYFGAMLKTYSLPKTTPRSDEACVVRASPERFQFAAEQIERRAAFPFPSADRRPRKCAAWRFALSKLFVLRFCASGIMQHGMRNLYDRGDEGGRIGGVREGDRREHGFRLSRIEKYGVNGNYEKISRISRRFCLHFLIYVLEYK